jgi:hypothetical protein
MILTKRHAEPPFFAFRQVFGSTHLLAHQHTSVIRRALRFSASFVPRRGKWQCGAMALNANIGGALSWEIPGQGELGTLQ